MAHGGRRRDQRLIVHLFACCTFINRRKWADLRFVAPRENAKDASDGLLYTRIVAASGRRRAEELRSKNLSNKRAPQPESFFLLETSLLTNEVVPFSKRVPHALRTESVATTISRNIQIGCSRIRSPNQMT